jgi:hypothetical protein
LELLVYLRAWWVVRGEGRRVGVTRYPLLSPFPQRSFHTS